MLATIPVGQAITFNYFISCGSLLGLQLGAVPAPRSGAASAPWTGWATWQLLKMKGLLFFSILNMIRILNMIQMAVHIQDLPSPGSSISPAASSPGG